ncbi:MAG: response regulator transcription factor [Acidobacteria bacterium]|nr:response regulator transcription factor [Acidobacteriota bacterium]
MRVLLVEDDAAISRFVATALQQLGYAVDAVESAERALRSVPDEAYDVMIVDIMLPGMDGLAFIEQCRGQGVTAPVLILSARRSVDERVEGLQRGGDDYLTKPFAVAELLARVEALTRRQKLPAGGSVLLQVEDLALDLARRSARRGDRVLDLSPRELSVLEYLCRNRGRVVTRAMILDHVWQMRFDPQTNVVDVYVHRLRKKVDREGEQPLIRTVRGVGYVLGG